MPLTRSELAYPNRVSCMHAWLAPMQPTPPGSHMRNHTGLVHPDLRPPLFTATVRHHSSHRSRRLAILSPPCLLSPSCATTVSHPPAQGCYRVIAAIEYRHHSPRRPPLTAAVHHHRCEYRHRRHPRLRLPVVTPFTRNPPFSLSLSLSFYFRDNTQLLTPMHGDVEPELLQKPTPVVHRFLIDNHISKNLAIMAKAAIATHSGPLCWAIAVRYRLTASCLACCPHIGPLVVGIAVRYPPCGAADRYGYRDESPDTYLPRVILSSFLRPYIADQYVTR
ncbi:hypothetical protein L1987_53856 [Smallanthus sonchifolius]|uniref:Uncharacterized protein n=1 Tax=Smallanthus sonchifolius TaxID=185202 RepID=A0ACB9EX07_9ASTR|nr:hypothetical protein L1987_53856 [Smallanthus sonchifolius]